MLEVVQNNTQRNSIAIAYHFQLNEKTMFLYTKQRHIIIVMNCLMEC